MLLTIHLWKFFLFHHHACPRRRNLKALEPLPTRSCIKSSITISIWEQSMRPNCTFFSNYNRKSIWTRFSAYSFGKDLHIFRIRREERAEENCRVDFELMSGDCVLLRKQLTQQLQSATFPLGCFDTEWYCLLDTIASHVLLSFKSSSLLRLLGCHCQWTQGLIIGQILRSYQTDSVVIRNWMFCRSRKWRLYPSCLVLMFWPFHTYKVPCKLQELGSG